MCPSGSRLPRPGRGLRGSRPRASRPPDHVAPRARRSAPRRDDRLRSHPLHVARGADRRRDRRLPRGLEDELSSAWLVVTVVGAGTIACKGADPVLLGGRSLPPQLAGVVEMQAFGADRKLVFDERLLGVAAAIVAIRLRAPLLAVVVVAAAVTALARL